MLYRVCQHDFVKLDQRVGDAQRSIGGQNLFVRRFLPVFGNLELGRGRFFLLSTSPSTGAKPFWDTLYFILVVPGISNNTMLFSWEIQHRNIHNFNFGNCITLQIFCNKEKCMQDVLLIVSSFNFIILGLKVYSKRNL